MSNSVYFDGFDLDTISGLDVINHEFNLYPHRELQNYHLAMQDKSAVTLANFYDKEVVVYCMSRNCTREAAEVILGTLRAKTQGKSKTLSVSQYNRTVSYTATQTSDEIRWVGNNLMIDLRFFCETPIGLDSATETVKNSTITTKPNSSTITLAGSALNQYPFITVTLTTIGQSGTQSVFIGNADDEIICEIERAWNDGEIITMNCETKEVWVNGAPVHYYGAVPDFHVGNNTFYYSDEFSSRSITALVTYQRRYA